MQNFCSVNLNKFIKPVLNVTGFFIFTLLLFVHHSVAAEEKQMRPTINQLTSEETAPAFMNRKTPKIENQSEERVPSIEVHKHSLGLGLGQTFLRSDLGNNGNDKITAELYYNYSASYSFDFLANLHWSEHEFKNHSSTVRGLALAIKGKGFQYDAFSPFVLGGFGFYLPAAHRTEGKTRDQLVFGMNAGIGADLRLNKEASVGIIAHYHDPFDLRQESGPDLQGSYLKLLITAMYTFN